MYPINPLINASTHPKTAHNAPPHQTTHLMDWTNFERIDPHLLLGIVNTALRNDFESLEDLCLSHDIDPEKLRHHLAIGGYQYLPTPRQFR